MSTGDVYDTYLERRETPRRRCVDPARQGIGSLAFTAAGKELLVGSRRHLLWRYALESGAVRFLHGKHFNCIEAVATARDRATNVAMDYNQRITVRRGDKLAYSVGLGEIVEELPPPFVGKDASNRLALTPDGRYLLIATSSPLLVIRLPD
jgi:hypothetical protein